MSVYHVAEQHVSAAQGAGPAKGVMLLQPPFQLAPWEWPDPTPAPTQAQPTGQALHCCFAHADRHVY